MTYSVKYSKMTLSTLVTPASNSLATALNNLLHLHYCACLRKSQKKLALVLVWANSYTNAMEIDFHQKCSNDAMDAVNIRVVLVLLWTEYLYNTLTDAVIFKWRDNLWMHRREYYFSLLKWPFMFMFFSLLCCIYLLIVMFLLVCDCVHFYNAELILVICLSNYF